MHKLSTPPLLRNTSRRFALGARDVCLVGKTPDMLRPGIVGIRESMVMRTTAMHEMDTPPTPLPCSFFSQVASRYFVHVGHLPGEEHRRVHHIAIRGTVSLADLSIDLKIRQVFDEECGCLFHAGFKEVADKVADDVVQFLEDGAEVKVAGHSLGGAVAIIVAAKLRLRGYDIGKVMTFGAPMVTDTAGAALLRDFIPVMRVTHERDPIPLTPLGRFKVSVVGGQRVQETEVDLEANPSQAEAWLDSAAMDGGRAEPEGTTGPSSVLKEGEGERGGGGEMGEDLSGMSGEGEGNGRRAGEKGADDAERWRVGSSSAYSHFGSHVRRDGGVRVASTLRRKCTIKAPVYPLLSRCGGRCRASVPQSEHCGLLCPATRWNVFVAFALLPLICAK